MTEIEIWHIIESYNNYYGLSYNQTILPMVSLENNLFKDRNIESG